MNDLDQERTFNLKLFMANHKDMTYENFTNFSSAELDELVEILNRKLGSSHREKKLKFRLKVAYSFHLHITAPICQWKHFPR